MSSIVFRKGTPEDADGVARVWVTSWHEAYADLLTGEELAGRTTEHRVQNWRDAFSEDRTSLWVAERDGAIVGFLLGRPTQDADLDPSRAGEVSALYILADAHGGGAGKGLMDRGLADLAGAGFDEAALWVLEGNDNAIGFYEHTGWTRDGGRKDCFGGANAPALRMRKPLNQARPEWGRSPLAREASATTRVRSMKVLVSERLSGAGIERLREHLTVDEKLGLSADELADAIGEYDALIVRSATKVTAELLERADNLKVVGRAGIGLDNVDVDAATRNGVLVVNAPQSNILSAAEHTIALMLAQARNIPQAHLALVDGKWERERWQGVELHGKTLGIIGLGRVGTLVAQRASAFGMRLVAYDPYVSPNRAAQMGVTLVESVDDVCKRADFLTIHLPRTPETMGIVGARQFDLVKPGVRIVNTARGGLIDEAALAAALKDGRVAGASVDVFENEPITEHVLFGLPNVVVTPHLGASTAEAQDKAGLAIAEQVLLALRGEFVPYAVNLDVGSDIPDGVRAYLRLTERLGRLAVGLTGTGMDTLRFEYHGGIAELDTRALTLAGLKGAFGGIVHEPVTYVNAPLMARERGISVEESRSSQSLDYVNLVEVRAGAEGRTVSVAGTLVGKKDTERLVRLWGYDLDMSLDENMVFLRYEDRPGVVGIVGTLLGEAGVNIANMQVGRQTQGGEALMALAVDSPIPDAVLGDIVERAQLGDARSVTLFD